MTQVIQLKRSIIAGVVPLTAELTQGEVVVNIVDGKLYFKKVVGSTESIVDITNFSNFTGLPTTLAGYGITNAQPLSVDLAAISVLPGSAGLLRKTAAGNWTLDTTAVNQTITITGDATGSGTSGIALSLAATAVAPGTYGSSSTIPVLTVDSKGRIISATTSAISGATVLFSTTTAAVNQVMDTNPITTYRTIKYNIQITSGTSYQSTEIRIMQNGTTAYINEYGSMFTGVQLATFDAAIASGNLQLLVSPVNAVNAIKFISQPITI